MRIAVDARPALWPTTGIGTIVRNVIARIQSLDRDNEYAFYFDREPPAGLVTPAYSHLQSSKMRWAHGYMRRALKAAQYDVFLSFLDKDVPLSIGRTKLICMVHDLIPLRFPETVFRNGLHRVYYNTLLRAATSRASIVLTNSEHSRQEIIQTLRLAANNIRKITLGVEQAPRPAMPGDRDTLQRLGVPGEYLLALGSTEPRKNNVRVMEAFEGLEGAEERTLVIAGSPWRQREFPTSLMKPNVVVTGYLEQEVLDCLMRNATALVFPSLHEGFGLPVLEAMVRGVPVITSNRTALPEVGGEAALYVDPESVEQIRDAIRTVIGDSQLRRVMAERGRAQASRFRWEQTCVELKGILAELA